MSSVADAVCGGLVFRRYYALLDAEGKTDWGPELRVSLVPLKFRECTSLSERSGGIEPSLSFHVFREFMDIQTATEPPGLTDELGKGGAEGIDS